MITFTESDFEDGYIKEGESAVTIVGVEQYTSVAGNPTLTIQMKDTKGNEDIDRVSLNANARWRLREIVYAAGFTREQLLAEPFNEKSLVGKRVILTKTVKGKREYNGKQYDDFSRQYSAHPEGADQSATELPF